MANPMEIPRWPNWRLCAPLAERFPDVPPLPDRWAWRIYEGVLVIEEHSEPVGWVALSDRVPFTAQLAHRIVADLAKDVR